MVLGSFVSLSVKMIKNRARGFLKDRWEVSDVKTSDSACHQSGRTFLTQTAYAVSVRTLEIYTLKAHAYDLGKASHTSSATTRE